MYTFSVFGLIWLRIRTGGRLWWMQYWTFGFHKCG